MLRQSQATKMGFSQMKYCSHIFNSLLVGKHLTLYAFEILEFYCAPIRNVFIGGHFLSLCYNNNNNNYFISSHCFSATTDERTDGWTDGRTDRQTDRQTDR